MVVGGTALVLLVIYMVVCLYIYHKVFTVVYFDMGKGLLKEVVGSFFISLLLTGLTLTFWPITAVICLIAGVVLRGKAGNNVPLIIAVVLAVFIAIVGISYNSSNASEEDAETSRVESIYTMGEEMDM